MDRIGKEPKGVVTDSRVYSKVWRKHKKVRDTNFQTKPIEAVTEWVI